MLQTILLPVLAAGFLAGCTQQEPVFCPNDGCADRLIEEMNAATASLHVAIAYFTHDGIADAIIAARDRGVEVRVLAEKEESGSGGINYDIVNKLKKAGITYRNDGNSALMHNKFTVVDGRTVLTGSFNYTTAADQQNDENLVVLTSEPTAGAFETEFERLWANGTE